MLKKTLRRWLGIDYNEREICKLSTTVARVDARSRTQDNDIINIMDRQQRLEKDYPLSTQPLEDK